MTDEKPTKAGNYHEWFGLRFEYVPWGRRWHRWGVSDGRRGVGGSLNPLTAYLALRRWRNIPARPS